MKTSKDNTPHNKRNNKCSDNFNYPRNYKLITFDLDDTLWHLAPVIEKANQQTYQWLQQHCPQLTDRYSLKEVSRFKETLFVERPDLRHQISQLRIESLVSLLLSINFSDNEARQLSQAAFEIFIRSRNEVIFFDYALESLTALKSDYMLGALSNGNACIKRLNLEHLFDFSFSAETLNASKPAPDHFEAAMAYSGYSAEQIIHVGDHPRHDIEAAQQLGICTIWMNWNKLIWQGNQPADAEINSLRELTPSIDYLEASVRTRLKE